MKSIILIAVLGSAALVLTQCDRPTPAVLDASKPSREEMIARGKYLTTIGGCNDCHSPKVMTPHGPEPDTTRLLSGHPQNDPLPPVVLTSDWIQFNAGLTATIGPWGLSYAANLTPDDTGLGNWTLEQFMISIRKGKYKGIESNRSLLPPMPWPMIAKMTDDDLEAVFTYLQSIPPVDNQVPQPLPPDEVEKLARQQ